jgi:hypothetical protein
MLSICAVIAVRNEVDYLDTLLPILANQHIDVAILDNDSGEKSQKLYARYAGTPIISVNHLRFNGVFSLEEQLVAKRKIYNKLKHDWVIHHDADEIMEHRQPGKDLRTAIEEAHDQQYNVLNFDEFVFLPEAGRPVENYYTELLNYYFFEPRPLRLNRAWRRDMHFDNTQNGGHRLAGENIRIAPTNHPLRHYVVLSNQHALKKYLSRRFSQAEINKGKHGNRLNFTVENLAIPEQSPFLFTLPNYQSKEFRRDCPTKTHYWEWDRNTIREA